jgi:hypothetical protein
VIGPSQGRYLNTEKRIHTPNIHALGGIRTYDHGFRASEDNACLRSLGYRDRLVVIIIFIIIIILGGLRLSPLATAATIGLLNQHQMIDDG